jgi:hypothetical protein
VEQIDAPAWKEINERWFSNTADLSRDSRKVATRTRKQIEGRQSPRRNHLQTVYHVFDYVTQEAVILKPELQVPLLEYLAGEAWSHKKIPGVCRGIRACELSNL